MKTAEQKIEAVRKVIDELWHAGMVLGADEDNQKFAKSHVMRIYANIAELLKRAIED